MHTTNRGRLQWIDFLRGLAMLFVIWGHIAPDERIFMLGTGPVKIPLFFAITGYLFNDRDGDVRRFAQVTFRRLVIPWLILSLFWARAGYSLITGHPETALTHVTDLLSGRIFWFMPCCILAECIQFLIRKLLRADWQRALAMALIAAAGLVMTRFGTAGFACFDVACTAQLMMLFGYWFRKSGDAVRARVRGWLLLPPALIYGGLLALSIILYPGRAIDMHHNDYVHLAIGFPMIFTGLLLLFVLVPRIPRFPRWMIFVGQNTLVFYLLHSTVRQVLRKALSVVRIALPAGLPGHIIEMVVICAAASVAAWLLNRYFPFAAGRRKAASGGRD